jgi:DnaA-homolog protein
MSAAVQLALDLLQRPQARFENFVVGRNGEALASLQALLEGRGTSRIVYLWGAAAAICSARWPRACSRQASTTTDRG